MRLDVNLDFRYAVSLFSADVFFLPREKCSFFRVLGCIVFRGPTATILPGLPFAAEESDEQAVVSDTAVLCCKVRVSPATQSPQR